jgi:peptidoglycan hydrolase-like protein with peptidoglycan-binding domain
MTKTRKASVAKAPSKRKAQKKKIIITTLAVGAAGIVGYFGWQYFKRRKGATHDDLDSIISNMNQPIVTTPVLPATKQKTKTKTTYTSPATAERNDDFPLKKGSNGENVRRLQEALITKYGKQTLPKYGVDGDFGSEMVAALKKLGLPATITESTLNVIAQGTTVNPATIGKELYSAANAKDFSKAISLLKKMRNTDDYTAANNIFKQERINGVRQTVVNGLLNVFSTEAQKQAIKFEFLRMGLQFDGSKWSLSGLDGLPIVTLLPTSVWINATESVKVPALMVLGNEVSKRLDYTLFENGGKHFLVQTKTVKYL